MVNGLYRLGHDAVVRRHHQNGNIRYLCAAGPHGRKGLMSRRIKEYDLLSLTIYLISADALRDPTRFMGRYRAFSNSIQERRLSVVHVPHNRNHRRAKRQHFRIILNFRDLRRIDLRWQRFRRNTELTGYQGRRIIIDFLIDGSHNPHQEQLFHDFGRRIAHLAGQIFNSNGLTNLDILRPGDLHLGLHRNLVSIFAVAPPAAVIIVIILGKSVAAVFPLAAPVSEIIAAAAVVIPKATVGLSASAHA